MAEPSVSVAQPATGPIPGRGPMRMPRRQRWVPNGILAKADEVIKPVAPPPAYQVSLLAIVHKRMIHWMCRREQEWDTDLGQSSTQVMKLTPEEPRSLNWAPCFFLNQF